MSLVGSVVPGRRSQDLSLEKSRICLLGVSGFRKSQVKEHETKSMKDVFGGNSKKAGGSRT